MDIIEELCRKPNLLHGKGASIDVINSYEKILGIKFFSDYRKYLLEFSIVAFSGHELTGISKSKRLNVVDVTLNERNLNENIPEDFYVVEVANIDGIVLWQNSLGEIYMTKPNNVPKKLYDSLGDFIKHF